MKITRNGVEIELTSSEIQQAYDSYLHDCKVLDAQDQFGEWLSYEGYEEEYENDQKEFAKRYGFSMAEVSDPASAHYMLERFVSKFDEKFDTSRAENDIWHEAIGDVMAEMAEEATKAAGDKAYQVTFQETHERKVKIIAASADAAKLAWERDYFDPQVSMTFMTGARIVGAVAISAEEVQ